MDASQYKDYVLVLLFLKYISDKYADVKYAPITIPKGSGFKDMVALKGKTDIGDQINKKIIAPLVKVNQQLSSSDFPDFNAPEKLGSGKEMVDRLTNLISIFDRPELDFSKNKAEGDDLLGDAYEYLMRHFATESGKSKGQFYTPAEVSRIMAKILAIHDAKPSAATTVYDPTCGSGSLLLKVADEAGTKVSLYGQEKDSSTSGLARMNMILHDNPEAVIYQGNTIADPKFKEGEILKTFDYVVANPPFSDKRWSTGIIPADDLYQRFQPYGVPPPKQGDYAYLLHILRSLKSNGQGACILPHGVLFRGNAEATIRKNLIARGYIKGIIGLPANLFYGTGIPACIVVLDKKNATARKGIFMIDASKGFQKDGPKNRLREQDLHKIVDTFTRQDESDPRYARMVPVSEIADSKNDYNLNLPRYIDSTEPEDLQDIDGHLRGGIPERDLDALGNYWKIMPGLRATLFGKSTRAGYSAIQPTQAEIKPTIFAHPEFTAFTTKAKKLLTKWQTATVPQLKGLAKDGQPKTLIAGIAEDLLTTFKSAPLLDAYDVYQHLMAYWAETMQDDCYLIAADGWKQAAQPQLIAEEKGKKSKAKPDFVLGKKKYQAELIPPVLMIGRFYQDEQAVIEKLAAEVASFEQQLEEIAEEHGGDEGPLADAANDKGKITKASATTRLKEVKGDKDAADEIKLLKEYLALADKEGEASDKLSKAEEALTEKIASRYAKLTEEEIKTLVVEDKWMATLAAAVQGELGRVSQTLTGRIRQLAERYATPLPQLTDEVATLAARVDGHLKKMGAVWK
jgi:type I restriction enzyme M protein